MKAKIENLALIDVNKLDLLLQEFREITRPLIEYNYINKPTYRERTPEEDEKLFFYTAKITMICEIKQSLIPAKKLAELSFDEGVSYLDTTLPKEVKEEFLQKEIEL